VGAEKIPIAENRDSQCYGNAQWKMMSVSFCSCHVRSIVVSDGVD
jgi:hypothetical protein